MKTLLSLCVLVLVSGCATGDLKSYATPANARTATTLVCSNALAFVKTDADRTETANYIYSVAHAVRTLSGGKVPTQQEMSKAIDVFTPDNGKWSTLGVNISSIWGAIYAQILSGNYASSNSKVALEYLEAIASGAEDAAAPYIPKS